jgi:hypothetical protein
VTVRCLEPLRKFRLTYDGSEASMDVLWSGAHPVFLYPVPPGTTESQFPRHIEQGGRVRGTVTVGGQSHAIDTVGHRDHSWGGERDWTRLQTWHYISGDFGDFSFNVVRVMMDGGDFSAGYVWDGKEIMPVTDIRTEVATYGTGRRQTAATIAFLDERERARAIREGDRRVRGGPGKDQVTMASLSSAWREAGLRDRRAGDPASRGLSARATAATAAVRTCTGP